MQLFEYNFDKISKGAPPFEETIDYRLVVPCVNRDDTLLYIFRSYRFGEFMYITDVFPKMYENDERCFKRFVSREGFSINMKKLSVTCLAIFVEHFIKNNERRCMVISGSYEDNENPEGASRKLRLYNYFFKPLLEQLNLRSVDMFEENAFILVSKSSTLSNEEIRQEYLTFKSMRK